LDDLLMTKWIILIVWLVGLAGGAWWWKRRGDDAPQYQTTPLRARPHASRHCHRHAQPGHQRPSRLPKIPARFSKLSSTSIPRSLNGQIVAQLDPKTTKPTPSAEATARVPKPHWSWRK